MEKRIFNREEKKWSDLEQDPDLDPLFNEMDPRIRIYVKMKRLRNTDCNKQPKLCKGKKSGKFLKLQCTYKTNMESIYVHCTIGCPKKCKFRDSGQIMGEVMIK